MAILLDHLIVPSHNPVASAQSLADILAVPWEAERGHFTPVYLNETLTLDFAQREQFDRHHSCFHGNDAEFDGIFARVRAISILSQHPGAQTCSSTHVWAGRNFYWNDSDGHNWKC
jgi:hypothetical protein